MSARKPAQRPDESGSLRVFVLDIDGRPTLAFEASDLAEAQEICRDADLQTDLVALTSDGAPVCTPGSILVAGRQRKRRSQRSAMRSNARRHPTSPP